MKSDCHCPVLKAELNGVVTEYLSYGHTGTDQTVHNTIEIHGKSQEPFCSPPKFWKQYVDGAFAILLK